MENRNIFTLLSKKPMSKEFSMKMNKSKIDVQESDKGKKEDKASKKTHPFGNSNVVKIDIPPRTIVMVFLAVIGIYLFIQLINVFLILFFAMVLASATLPLISGMVKRGFPKWLSIGSVYVLLISFLTALIFLIVFPFVSQMARFSDEVVKISETSLQSLENFNVPALGIEGSELKVYFLDHIEQVSKEIIPSVAGTVTAISTTVDALVGVGGVMVMILTILILSVYIVADHDRVVDLILIRIHEKEKRERIRELIVDVEYKLGRWLVGQSIVSSAVGFMTWLVLTIFQVPFALPLAVLAALFEVVPNLGPVLVSIPITLIALLTHGPLVAILVLVSYIIIQQLQSYLLSPRIMGKVVGLHPLVIFIAMITGFTLAGIIGAILAIPTLVLAKIGYKFYRDLQKLQAKGMV